MKEAYVKCKWSIPIRDLNLDMVGGRDYWLSLDEAKSSKDLSHAEHIGAVSVHRKERFRMVKPRHLPPFAALSRKGAQNKPPQQPKPIGVRDPAPAPKPQEEPVQEAKAAPEPATKVEVKVDAQEIARAVREAVSGELSATVSQLVQAEMQKAQSPGSGTPDADVLAEALSKALAKNLPAGLGSAPQTSRKPVSSEDELLFMPSNIVDKNAKGSVSVKQDTTEGGIDDAAEMLRALRKKGKDGK